MEKKIILSEKKAVLANLPTLLKKIFKAEEAEDYNAYLEQFRKALGEKPLQDRIAKKLAEVIEQAKWERGATSFYRNYLLRSFTTDMSYPGILNIETVDGAERENLHKITSYVKRTGLYMTNPAFRKASLCERLKDLISMDGNRFVVKIPLKFLSAITHASIQKIKEFVPNIVPIKFGEVLSVVRGPKTLNNVNWNKYSLVDDDTALENRVVFSVD